jgi:hypothetical protein
MGQALFIEIGLPITDTLLVKGNLCLKQSPGGKEKQVLQNIYSLEPGLPKNESYFLIPGTKPNKFLVMF